MNTKSPTPFLAETRVDETTFALDAAIPLDCMQSGLGKTGLLLEMFIASHLAGVTAFDHAGHDTDREKEE